MALARPPCGAHTDPENGCGSDFKSRFERDFASIFDAGAVLDDRVLLIILLWPVADLVRMTAVTLACVMILMRPFIPFFYVASFVAFCALWFRIIGGDFQPAGAFAFWSVALGAIPAIWDVLLGFIAPDMDWNIVNG